MSAPPNIGKFVDFYELEAELLIDARTCELDIRVLRLIARLFSKIDCFDSDIEKKLTSTLLRSDLKLGLDYALEKPQESILGVLISNWKPYYKSVHLE